MVRGLALLVVLALAGTACGSEDGATGSSGATDTTAATSDASSGGDTASDDTASEDTGSDGTGGSTTSEAGTGSGSATVTHAGSQYEFVVIQCVRDVPSAITDSVVALQADGVTAGTPDGVVADLLGVIEEGTDVAAALAPALAHGPVLSVTRVEGGGDQLAIITESEPIVTTADPTDPAHRFLDIDGGTVSGTGSTDQGAMSLDLTCP
ncbi:hypothetical protein [Rhabdothermincola salaria]|uniref:hypothetical protein n=1 Tax=Rhabdothermincola salaria TaxID=2903142 RepID=UPI001E59D7B4|nr:hypothetical protein [Rhabdothermincola salaria]MCD9622683.1 hypothetical protein [Rhabdothermincola salaria]